jgi:hypothetical protein
MIFSALADVAVLPENPRFPFFAEASACWGIIIMQISAARMTATIGLFTNVIMLLFLSALEYTLYFVQVNSIVAFFTQYSS